MPYADLCVFLQNIPYKPFQYLKFVNDKQI